MKRVLITRRLPAVARDLLAAHFAVDENATGAPLPAERLAEAVAAYDGILSTVADRFSSDVLARADRLRVISNYATGLDNVDLDGARRRSIAVYNLPDVVTDSTADLTLALLLALVRRIPQAQQFVRDGGWRQWDPELLVGEELAGKTYGVLGCGRIGRAVARRAAGFGMTVLCAGDPARALRTAHDGPSRHVPLEELLEGSDYVSLHVPLNQATRGMVDLAMMERMRRRPILINAARGPVVRTDDLAAALGRGLLRGAALDVTDPEPIPPDHPLLRLESCLIVPHIGTATAECRHLMAQKAAERIVEHLGASLG